MNNLKVGSTGTETYILQSALNRSGHNIAVDGIFGEKTLHAIKQFQIEHGLSPDGIAGPKTAKKLEDYIRGFTRHTVVRGDTLYSVAKEHSTSPAAIAAANPNVMPGNLKIGSVLTVPYSFPVVMTDVPYTYELTSLIIRGILARYPSVKDRSAGQSIMGRPLTVMSIGEGNKTLFINASHHANEWITTPTVLKFFEEYSSAATFDKPIYGLSAKMLFLSSRLVMLPLVNPDGVDLVNGIISNGKYYDGAKMISSDYPDIPFPSGWKANIAGVDLNLQYPADWELAREIKYAQGYTSPAPRDYVGPAPLSAPESSAVYNLTKSNDFAVTLSYHTQGNIIYWRFKDMLPKGSFELGKLLADKSGYPLAKTPYASSNAGYKDFFILDYDRPGYTIEAGFGQNPLPISQFDSIYAANAPLMSQALAWVAGE
mgnify:FL=1